VRARTPPRPRAAGPPLEASPQAERGETPPRPRRSLPPLTPQAREVETAGHDGNIAAGTGHELVRLVSTASTLRVARSAPREKFSELAVGAWKGLSRQQNQAASGVGLHNRQIHTLRRRAAQAQAQSTKIETFWQMQELVRERSPQEIIDILVQERDRYINPLPNEPGRWESRRAIDGSLPAGLVPWGDAFGHARAGVNHVDEVFGWTIGMHAAAQGKVETVQALLAWDPREGCNHDFSVDCRTTFRLDVTMRSRKTRRIAWAARQQRDEADGKEWRDPVLLECYGIVDAIGSTMIDIARRRTALKAASNDARIQTLITDCATIRQILKKSVADADKKLQDAHNLAGVRNLATGESTYFDEAEYRLQIHLGETNMFGHFARCLIELYALDEAPERQADSLCKMKATFEAWNMSDPSLIGLGSEAMSHLLLDVFTMLDTAATRLAEQQHADGSAANARSSLLETHGGSATEKAKLAEQINILRVMLRKLGAATGAGILDFTVQNSEGRTPRQLAISISRDLDAIGR
jgi:hypothetical protein